jgi:hypothetical protein
MRHKSIYIGHYISDELFEYSNNYLHRLEDNYNNNISLNNTVKVSDSKYFGISYLLTQIAKKIGLYDDLKSVFPYIYICRLFLWHFI